MRIPLNHDKLVYIPRGVAHGAANHMTHAAEILYFVSSHYNKDNPDEQRLPWDATGKEFWEIKRE
jgi:dTDP-4-dehydrorhamnose 3,5-epimerase